MKYFICSFFVLCFFLSYNLCSQDSFGKIIPIKGVPVIKGKPDFKVTVPTPLNIKDKIVTDGNSFAKVIYNDGTTLKLMPNTHIAFHKHFIRMKKGNAYFNFKKQGQKFKIFFPTALVGVYGTKFSINVIDNDIAEVALFSGSIDAQALYGNKKRVNLSAGKMLTATRDGIVNAPVPIKKAILKTWEKFEIFGYGGATGNNDSSALNKEDIVTTEEGEEEISELETNGKIQYSIIPWGKRPIDTSYKILINGYSYHNGKHLIGNRGKAFRFKKLEADTYDFTVFINGTEYSFSDDIDISKNGYCYKIPYKSNEIEINIDKYQELTVMKELENQKFSAVLHSDNGLKKLNIFHDAHPDIKEGQDNILWSRRKLYFNYPKENPPPAIEFTYFGDIETKVKKIMLQLTSDERKYKVNFK